LKYIPASDFEFQEKFDTQEIPVQYDHSTPHLTQDLSERWPLTLQILFCYLPRVNFPC
jgi:hypothetical protein